MTDQQHKSTNEAARIAKQRHRVSLLILIAVVVVFLVLTGLFTIPPALLRTLYIILIASAIYLMWTTMRVMISRRPGSEE